MHCRYLIAAMSFVLFSVALTAAAAAPPLPARFIVQAQTAPAAQQYVERLGGRVERDLAIINGVSALLDPWQVDRLRATAGVRLYEDRAVATEGLLNLLSPVTAPVVRVVSSTSTPTDGSGVLLPTLLYETNYPTLVDAATLQQAGITGRGVTIAVLDTGLWQGLGQNFGPRLLASIDVLNGGGGAGPGDPLWHRTPPAPIPPPRAHKPPREKPRPP